MSSPVEITITVRWATRSASAKSGSSSAETATVARRRRRRHRNGARRACSEACGRARATHPGWLRVSRSSRSPRRHVTPGGNMSTCLARKPERLLVAPDSSLEPFDRGTSALAAGISSDMTRCSPRRGGAHRCAPRRWMRELVRRCQPRGVVLEGAVGGNRAHRGTNRAPHGARPHPAAFWHCARSAGGARSWQRQPRTGARRTSRESVGSGRVPPRAGEETVRARPAGGRLPASPAAVPARSLETNLQAASCRPRTRGAGRRRGHPRPRTC